MASDNVALLRLRERMEFLENRNIKRLGGAPDGVDEQWIDIRLPDGWISRTKLIWPTPQQGQSIACPLITYMHGGGYCSGSPGQALEPGRGLALHFKAIVACTSYKLAPEHPWPAPVESAYEVCAWLSDPRNLNDGPLKGTGVSFQPDLGFVVGGISVGGNFAAVIGGLLGMSTVEPELLTRRTPFHASVSSLFLTIPGILSEAMVPERFRDIFRSRQENSGGNGDGLTTMNVVLFENIYRADVRSPWFSPVVLDPSEVRSSGRHPAKVFIQGGAKDALRDDAVIYQKWLEEAGVETKLVLLQDLGHCTWTTMDHPRRRREEMREASLDGMGWLLGRSWDRSRDCTY